MTDIRRISSTETYPVRHPVLRRGKPLETCRFEGDERASTEHYGLFDNGELTGVASLFETRSSYFAEENQAQLRGMAVLESHQKKGFGEKLVRFAEEQAKAKGASLMWFNARIIAVPFYEKCGYSIIGDPFDIGDIGEHFVMFKRL
ncbi:MAG TPA: GNAT family N-acetyltransferase [Flavobacterium sp.]